MKTATTLLVFCVSSLLALGLVMIYSAGDVRKAGGTQYFVAQSISMGAGLAACLLMTFFDYRFLKRIAWPLFIVTIGLLVWVLFQKEINGSRRWFRLGHGFSFQPSELAKISLLILVAWYGDRFSRHMPTFVRGIVVPGLFVGLILGLVLLQPDVGTTLLLASISFLVLLLAGMRLRYCILPGLLAAVVGGYFLIHDAVRSERIQAWLHPKETRLGKGSQAWEARVAFGAGGVTGRGLGSSRQKLGFVAEHHTDFIFPIIGEELGLPATLGVVIAFVLLLCAGFSIAARAPDTFGVLLGAGITLLFGLQAFVNIAVVTGVLPNKGLPLPFISYGGSNLILMLGCVGILLSIARRSAVNTTVPASEMRDAPALAPQMT